VTKPITYIDRQRIIDINKKIIQIWNSRHPENPERFDVRVDRIDEVLNIVKNAANDLDYEKSLIKKAAYLVGGLAWNQAFSGANKRTAILACTLFLSENGYRLNIPQNRNPELRQLLFDIQGERYNLNKETIDKIILYITKLVNKL
jgi:death-on-curing family protein